MLVAAGTAAGVALYLSRPVLGIALVDVTGYTDPMPIWMPFRVALRLENPRDRPVVVRQIHVTPDLDAVNEAYSFATPPELESPIRIEPGASATYEAVVTILNASQLAERTYPMTFRVLVDTDLGEVHEAFDAELDYVSEPARRTLRRASPPR